MTTNVQVSFIELPNLDGMTLASLIEFWHEWNVPTVENAVALVGTRENAVALAQELALYAYNKAISMIRRNEGNISKALQHENICDTIYKRLPGDLRW